MTGRPLNRRRFLSSAATLACFPAVSASLLAKPRRQSLAAFGCAGDGKTDDTAAIMKALNAGVPLTGDGRWYAVSGVRAAAGLDLEDTGLRALSQKPVGALLDVTGPAAVRLHRVKIDRAATLGTTMARSVGIRIIGADGVDLEACEVFGGGAGTGMFIIRCRAVRNVSSVVRDMRWAEDHDPGHGGERIQAIRHQDCEDVAVRDAAISDLTGKFGNGEPWAYQTDGLVFGNCRNFRVIGGSAAHVGEAIDCAGSGANRDFVIDGFNTYRAGSFGIKVVSSAQNGVVRNSVHREPGLAGCVTGGSVDGVPLRNVIFEHVNVISPGKNRNVHWAKHMPVGFWVIQGSGPPAEGVSFIDCETFDDSGSMRYAFRNESANPVKRSGGKSQGYSVAETVGLIDDR